MKKKIVRFRDYQWLNLPKCLEIADILVDEKGNIIIFYNGESPYESDGNFGYELHITENNYNLPKINGEVLCIVFQDTIKIDNHKYFATVVSWKKA